MSRELPLLRCVAPLPAPPWPCWPAVAFLMLRGPLAGTPAGAPSASAIAAGSLRISATPMPEAPRVGANELRIRSRTRPARRSKAPRSSVRWTMAAMGSMPAMHGRATAESHGPGEYRARFDLAMGGTWRLEIEARPPGAEAVRLEGSLTTGLEGIALAAPSALRNAAVGGGRERRNRRSTPNGVSASASAPNASSADRSS